ncbi:MAG: OmpA family protein [Gammaproteobacteria bacterium]|nr:OmpA family protein [Gammaproteobacteria bacterium]
MIIKKVGVLICAFTLQAITSVSFADSQEEDGAADRSWYLGAGLGITELDPDTGTTGYSVTDEKDSGFKLFGGYDFSERLTVEGFYADLGSAQLSNPAPSQPDGEIDYSTLGASVLWYFIRNGENKGKDLRKGLQVYAHGGLSFLSNSSSVAFSQDNSFQVQYGAGLEYGLNNGIALRAGIDLYDKDAGMVFVGVLKRFGTKYKRKVIVEPEPVIEPVVEPVVEPVQTQAVVIPEVVVTYDTDSDNDGVIDRLDDCADSPKDFSVDEKGCSIIELDFGGVNFEPKSFDLTQESKHLLDEVVVTINVSPELQEIEVQAHTDYKGSGEDNIKLSEQRAQSVKNYLISQGVLEKRLIAKGYGESQPIADNKTEEGRAKNRRVELKVIKDDVPEGNAE